MESRRHRSRAIFRLLIHAVGAVVALAVVVHSFPAWSATGFQLPGIRYFDPGDDGSAVAVAISLIVLAYCFVAIAFAAMDLKKATRSDDVTPFI